MNAHKVPATYLAGWKAKEYNHSLYVFYKDNLQKAGIPKKYKGLKK